MCSPDRSGCFCVPGKRTRCCCVGTEVSEISQDMSTNAKKLNIFNTTIERISEGSFARYKDLEEIEISMSTHLYQFDATSLKSLPNLRRVSITHCPNLQEISGKLIKDNFKLQSITISHTGLKRMPALEMTRRNRMENDVRSLDVANPEEYFDVEVDLSHNQIQYIGDERVKEIRARSLRMNNNRLVEIAGHAFQNSHFMSLNFSHNPDLKELSLDAFKDIVQLESLDLSHTGIYELPSIGLKKLKSLSLRNVPHLKRLPPVLSFTHLQKAHFTYPHHCCLFKHVEHALEYRNNSREIHARICKSLGRRVERFADQMEHFLSTSSPNSMFLGNPSRSSTELDFLQQLFAIASDLEKPDEDSEELLDNDLPPFAKEDLGFEKCQDVMEIVRNFYFNITCTPEPDALNPCENIVGYPLLRRAIWVVWIAAIVGNALVWIVLAMAYERRMRVHYMFMFNLSVADLITGVYLALLAMEDSRTADEYYRYAVAWQTGWGCSTAGFLAVFASQLSIISMFFIAFEMAYNTRKAIYGTRLRFSVGASMLFAGYGFASLMAALPLFGISSYSTSSICLPLRVEGVFDQIYIIFGLLFNITAFSGMVICYVFIVWMLKMEDPSTPSRPEDRAVILKMALLIVTDMICWFPTLFFGMTAALGFPLISLSNAKIFLVFFFPINSFANPFLYVFFTKVIQRHVKKKAVPAIKRIVSTPVLSSLSQFYHSNPPNERKRHDETSLHSINNKFLGVTQTTDALSPRGSNATYRSADGSLDLGSEIGRKSPRVSFQDEVEQSDSPRPSTVRDAPVYSPPNSPRKSKISSRLEEVWKKFSSIPEVSEHSGSDGQSNTNGSSRNIDNETEREETRRKHPFSLPFRHPNLLRRREESTKSNGDSGRGSLTSISTNGNHHQERLSLSVATQEGEGSDEEQSRQLLPRSAAKRRSEPHIGTPVFHLGLCDAKEIHVDGSNSVQRGSVPSYGHAPFGSAHKPHGHFFRWTPSDRRRRSVPAVTPLLVVSECSDNSTNS